MQDQRPLVSRFIYPYAKYLYNDTRETVFDNAPPVGLLQIANKYAWKVAAGLLAVVG